MLKKWRLKVLMYSTWENTGANEESDGIIRMGDFMNRTVNPIYPKIDRQGKKCPLCK
jgi:hypothetical protein